MTRRRPMRSGVTLIETLAALAVLAAVAPVLGRAWLVSMDAAGQSRDQLRAASLAANRLSELVVEGESLTVRQNGKFEDAPGYEWQAELAAWPENPRLSQLDVTVSWERRGQSYTMHMSTLVATGE